MGCSAHYTCLFACKPQHTAPMPTGPTGFFCADGAEGATLHGLWPLESAWPSMEQKAETDLHCEFLPAIAGGATRALLVSSLQSSSTLTLRILVSDSHFEVQTWHDTGRNLGSSSSNSTSQNRSRWSTSYPSNPRPLPSDRGLAN